MKSITLVHNRTEVTKDCLGYNVHIVPPQPGARRVDLLLDGRVFPQQILERMDRRPHGIVRNQKEGVDQPTKLYFSDEPTPLRATPRETNNNQSGKCTDDASSFCGK